MENNSNWTDKGGADSHRTRAHRVDSDPLFHLLVGKRARKRHNRALGAGVVQQIRAPDVRIDACVIDDSVTGFHVRDAEFREVVEGVDVGVEGLVPLLDGQLGNVLLHHLERCVVDEDVDGAHGGESGVDCFLAVGGGG